LQRWKIARLHQETLELKEQVERETGQPIQLTAEQCRLLAKKAEGIDAETLKQISILAPEGLPPSEPEADSAETRQPEIACCVL